ncbi:MAG: hypothetical protein MJ152_03935, partial [Clostridia bacterium]|nr:hypothetical protein [Clostridia bacterium]
MEKCKYEGCGSCSLLKMDYPQQLALKKKKVEAFFKAEGIKTKVEDVVGMNFPFKYRNKVHLAVEEFHGRLNIGFYEENSKKVINIESCLLHDKWLADLIAIIKKYIRDFKIQPYNRRSGTGTLRYVVARCLGQNIMVTLVVTNQNFGGKEILYKELKKKFKEVSLYLNVNNRTDSAVFSDRFVFKYGERKLHSSMLGVEFGISPNSFLQVNNEIAKKIYSKVVEEIKNSKQENVVDLF